MYREVSRSNGLIGSGDNVNRSGVGVGVIGAGKIFTAGELKKTELQFDLAIRGPGFFEVVLADGTRAYTRAGSFQLDKDGFLTTPEGYLLNPALQIPSDTVSVTIEATGRVLAKVQSETDPIEVGTIVLADFANPAGLKPHGENMYLPTDKSGDAILGKPGERTFGSLAQGFLESSNVKLVEEFINLIVAQRAYPAPVMR
jgi:flagellar basal-body rod protein FlgG